MNLFGPLLRWLRPGGASAPAEVVAREEQAGQLARRFDTALNNMSQGLCFFDGAQRLVVCNRRYIDMYGLSPERVRPGTTLREIVAFRFEAGSFPAMTTEQYLAWRDTIVIGDEPSDTVVELQDGRTFEIHHRPMPDRGWVATHEDVTEKYRAQKALAAAKADAERAEAEAREAHRTLLDALDAIPEGMAVFDADDRYVLWNRRYVELYAESGDLVAAGVRFADTLRAGLARGQYADATGREDEWLKERLARHALPHDSHEQRLPGDRWLRIEERRTANGGSIGVRIDITDLKRREESFRLLFEANPAPMWVFDLETLRFLAVNNAALEQYGYSREQFLAMTLLDIRPSDEEEAVRQAVAAPASGRIEKSWRHIRADGTEIEVVTYASMLTYQGRAARIVVIFDLTERKRAENELRRTRAFLDTVIENVPSMLFVKEPREQRYILVNRAGEQLLGVPREDLIGKNDYDLYPREEAEVFIARDREILEGDRSEVVDEEPIHTIHNGVRFVTTKRLAIRDDSGAPQYLLGVAEDITERKRAEERIAHLARHDPLTDLPNRSAFTQQLARTIADATEDNTTFALMFIDLDRFKEVNDVFGHAVGDGLLREVARRFATAAEGAFLARLGGDEFTLIVAGGRPRASLAALADRLVAALATDIVIEEKHLRIGTSVGVAVFPADGTDPSTLLGNADAALYRAKAQGRGSVYFFAADMDIQLRERRALQHDLQAALTGGELVLHYQPQVRIDGETTGFEALVRWNHPSRGLIQPKIFIPIAEEGGLIISIGEWVLREACREAVSWPKPLQVAVNISPAQFRHGDLPALVHSVLLESGLAAARLELEVTETVMIDDFSRALSILRRLKSLGVRIAMDDFGNGYSSLSYLQSFPFDKIKIDRTFISNVERNAQSAAIVRGVIGLARGLNMPVVGEGVETGDELEFLSHEACDEVQGFLIGRPAPIETYGDLVGRPGALKEASA
jgi:diguanylate cyclase (GGDEF)-like protein/PAS domain S-box-containing protein